MWPTSPSRPRNQRGVVFPSPVVILSVVAVAMAAIAYVATQGQPPTEREVTRVAAEPSPSATPEPSMPTTKPKPTKPAIDKGKVYVEVYNNSGITGLAATKARQLERAGWNVAATDNWYGNIPANTVYYPARLEDSARDLAKTLHITRTRPAVSPMQFDRLTVIYTH